MLKESTSKKVCPGCVMATNCVQMNDPLDKKGALALLELLIKGDTQVEKSQQLDLLPKSEQQTTRKVS